MLGFIIPDVARVDKGISVPVFGLGVQGSSARLALSYYKRWEI